MKIGPKPPGRAPAKPRGRGARHVVTPGDEFFRLDGQLIRAPSLQVELPSPTQAAPQLLARVLGWLGLLPQEK